MYQATSVALARQFLRLAGGARWALLCTTPSTSGSSAPHLADVLTASAAGFATGALLNYGSNDGVGATVVFRGVRGASPGALAVPHRRRRRLGLISAMVTAATRSLGLHDLARISATGVVLL